MSTVIEDSRRRHDSSTHDGGTRRRRTELPQPAGTPLPLDGIKIVDFTQVFMGPSCTQLLGDYGADVIKVERPGAGDISRNSFPDKDGQDNPIFLSINRNKRSISVDTRTDEGKDVLRRLLSDADVVVSNFRSGVMERMGFGYEDLKAENPGIIWASGTGFGPVGPYSHKGGQDAIAQAYSGVMWRRESEDDEAVDLPHHAVRLHHRHAPGAGHPAGAAHPGDRRRRARRWR